MVLIVLGRLVVVVHSVLVHANGGLGLVKDGVTGVLIFGAAGLVGKGLASGLGVVRLGAAVCIVSVSPMTEDESCEYIPSSLVGRASDALLGLVESGLGGVRSDLLLSL